MKKDVRIPTPVTRNLRSLFKEPLPREPVMVHMSQEEWKGLSGDIPTSKRKIREDAKGMFVIPDPFGGYLGFFACAAGSKKGLACLPELVISGGSVTSGGGCTCIGGRDPFEELVPSEQETCSLGISSAGGFSCTGRCSTGKKCTLIKVPTLGGRVFITCACS